MEWVANISPRAKTILTVTLTAVSVLLVVSVCSAASLDWYYAQRVYPGVKYGTHHLGGLTREEAAAVLDRWQDEWWQTQLEYVARDEQGQLLASTAFYPVVVAEGNGQSYELVWYDVDRVLSQAFAQGRVNNPAARVFNIARAFFRETAVAPVVHVNRDQLKSVLQSKLASYETIPQDAALVNRTAYSRPVLTPPTPGNTFDYDQAVADTEAIMRDLRRAPIALHRAYRVPAVTAAEAERALAGYDAFLNQFPLSVTYDDPAAGILRRWNVYWPMVYHALTLAGTPDGGATLALDDTKLDAVWAPIEAAVNVQAADAKFEISTDNKVQLFEPSRVGAAVDRAATFAAMLSRVQTLAAAARPGEPAPEAPPIALVVNTIQPAVTTDTVNDLGITEVLGVGYSNYSGSPRNRVHNISVGVNKLNGTLIPPGTEFSLLTALRPFTAEAGYKPELVIKGDKIEPEIGGGLCQIGSTTFRAAMNSGLAITERRNHSLVVSYYNDPRNGNPGTDATIYDPAPDLKFMNDTGHYILITTSMNYNNGDLVFTFWGTSDGRKGSYTEPVVSRWIPTGPEKLIETTDLEPGKKECQSPHIGAVASFTYSVAKPDGAVVDQIFTSTYRPLPKICLIGVDPNAPAEPLPTTDPAAPVAPDGAPIAF